MDRQGLKALSASKQRTVLLGGASFLIKNVDFQEAVEALGPSVQTALLSYFFDTQDGLPEEQKKEAEHRLHTDAGLQKAMLEFRRNVLTMGMVDPVLTVAGEAEDLDPEEDKPAKVSLATLDDLATELQGEILGGDSGKADAVS